VKTWAARRPPGVRVFASPSEEPRARRPTDTVLLAVNAALLVLIAILADTADRAESAAASFVADMPGILNGLWAVLDDVLTIWAVTLVLVALFARKRLTLARDLVLAGLASGVVAMVVNNLVDDSGKSIVDQFKASEGPPSFPALRFGIAAAIVVTASPHLSRPLRYLGRWLIVLAALATVALGAALPGGIFGALAIAGAAAAIVHLAFGSPGGRPSLGDVTEALAELGVEAGALEDAALQPEGTWSVIGTQPSGDRIRIKVYGRDAWDGQLVMSLWRFIWYRDSGRTISVSRIQQVEHEAFLTLLASSAGLRVPSVLAAGRSEVGDALLVLSAHDTALSDLADPTDELLSALWRALDTAHATGISPGRIEPQTIGVDDDGGAAILEWVTGQTAPSEQQVLQDGAQLLISTAMIVGDDRAIDAVIAARGERAADLLPYLQPAGLSRSLRHDADVRHYDIKALRVAAAERLDVQLPDLVQLRRVTVGSIISAGLLVFAGFALVTAFSSVDFASVSDEFRNMAIGAVIIGFVLTQLARASGAFSNVGASPVPLPFGPLVQLQFACAYVNMAVPSTAGRLAVVARFYQRVGSTAVTAIGASAVDSFSNFLVQIVLVVGTIVLGLGTFDFSLDDAVTQLPSGLWKLVVVVFVGLVVIVVVVLAVPALRKRVSPMFVQFRRGIAVLRKPRKAALLLGGNLLVQVLYSLALGTFVWATGYHVNLADLLLILNLVGTFASMIPVPNGVGVTEAGLSAGLVAAGVPESSALAAVLAYRLCSSYLPPIWGFFSMRWLQKHDYL
jgi:uncharacterized membrane protein YbhN (UPF0104 family)